MNTHTCTIYSTTSVLKHPPSAQEKLLVIWFLNACYGKAERCGGNVLHIIGDCNDTQLNGKDKACIHSMHRM